MYAGGYIWPQQAVSISVIYEAVFSVACIRIHVKSTTYLQFYGVLRPDDLQRISFAISVTKKDKKEQGRGKGRGRGRGGGERPM